MVKYEKHRQVKQCGEESIDTHIKDPEKDLERNIKDPWRK